MGLKLMSVSNKHGTAVQKTAGGVSRPCLDGPSMSTKDADNDSSDVECPTCGRGFTTRSGASRHHSQTHGLSFKELERQKTDGYDCPKPDCSGWFANERGLKNHYGKKHELSPKHIDIEDLGRLDELIRCPHDGCNRVFYGEDGLKVHHKKIHGESIAGYTNECKRCGTTIHISAEDAHRDYCSPKCRNEAQAERMRGENHHSWTDREQVACEWCGDLFDPQTGNPNRFCSPECNSAWQSESFGDEDWHLTGATGPDHPCYVGHDSYYGENWDEQRRKCLERDKYTCQSCGIVNGDHIERHGVELHVHHIRPKRKYETPEASNVLNNLVALCRPCHGRWEGIPLRPQ